jgi:hypothetical protein
MPARGPELTVPAGASGRGTASAGPSRHTKSCERSGGTVSSGPASAAVGPPRSGPQPTRHDEWPGAPGHDEGRPQRVWRPPAHAAAEALQEASGSRVCFCEEVRLCCLVWKGGREAVRMCVRWSAWKCVDGASQGPPRPAAEAGTRRRLLLWRPHPVCSCFSAHTVRSSSSHTPLNVPRWARGPLLK